MPVVRAAAARGPLLAVVPMRRELAGETSRVIDRDRLDTWLA
jgi:hypothetical protein